jgi:hypothetical protein
MLTIAPGVGGAQSDDPLHPATTSSPRFSAVEIRIGAVIASNSSRDFDPRLVALHKQFNALFAYTSYQLVKEEKQRVPWGGKAGFDIPGGRYVVVIPKEYKNDRVAMKVMVIEGARPIVDTALALKNHATLLVGGPRQPDGVLILSIGADLQ